MNNSNFTMFETKAMRPGLHLIASALIVAVSLMSASQSIADEPRVRVLAENVPGADEIRRGNYQVGIEILEDRLQRADQGNSGDMWSTLCAAYVATVSLKQAEHACNKAVEVDPSNHALNNRGVFHLSTGDLSRAREDFDRARPLDVEAYLDELKRTNARLVAASNFDLVNEMLAERSLRKPRASSAFRAAAIEPFDK